MTRLSKEWYEVDMDGMVNSDGSSSQDNHDEEEEKEEVNAAAAAAAESTLTPCTHEDRFGTSAKTVPETTVGTVPAFLTASFKLDDDPSSSFTLPVVNSSETRFDFDQLFALLEESKPQHDPTHSDTSTSTVLAFLGLSGAGKTTTLLHLAGVQFEQVEKHGCCWHLQPVYEDSSSPTTPTDLRRFVTDCGVDSVTKMVQTHAMIVGENAEKILLLDGPGLDDTHSLEAEIAHHVAWMQAIQQCQRVRPVVVLAVDAVGSRFTQLLSALEQVSRLTQHAAAMDDDFDSFQYVFTKAEGSSSRWKSRIPSMLRYLREQMGATATPEKARLAALLDDMIFKTNTSSGPILVQPTEGLSGDETLAAILGHDGQENGKISKNESFRIVDSGLFFHAALSQATVNALRVELQLLIRDVEISLNSSSPESFGLAIRNVKILVRMQELLPDVVSSYLKEVKMLVAQHASACRINVQREIERLSNLRHEDPRLAQVAMRNITKQLTWLGQWDDLLDKCQVPEPNRLPFIMEMCILPFVEQMKNELTESLAAMTPDEIFTISAHQELLRWNFTCLYGLKDPLPSCYYFPGKLPIDFGVSPTFRELFKTLEAIVELVLLALEKHIRKIASSDESTSLLSVSVEIVNVLVGFLVNLNRDLVNFLYVDQENKLSAWISRRLNKALEKVEKVMDDHCTNLSETCELLSQTLLDRSNWASSTVLVELDGKHLGCTREAIVALVKSAPNVSKAMACDFQNAKKMMGQVAKFDGLILDYLVELGSFCQVRLEFPTSSTLQNPQTIVSESLALNAGIKDAIELCSLMESWTDFDTAVMGELKDLMKKTLLRRRVTQAAVSMVAAAVVLLPIPK